MNNRLAELGIPDQLAEDALLCGVSHDGLCYAMDQIRLFIGTSQLGGSNGPQMKTFDRLGLIKAKAANIDQPKDIIAAFYEIAGCIIRIPHFASKRLVSTMFFGAEGDLLMPLFEHISARPSGGAPGSFPGEGK